jgi:hypothetical protein
MPLNVFNTSIGGSWTSAQVRAYLYADLMGARITSNSYGGPGYSKARQDALNISHAIFVCSVGNEGQDNDVVPVYPASYDNSNIISVANINKFNEDS